VLDKLKSLNWSDVTAVLGDVNTLLQPVVGTSSTTVPVFATPQEPSHVVPTLAVEPPPPIEPTTLDLLFGRSLTGYKTYLVIAIAAAVNVAATLGLAPAVLTPPTVAAINTLLSALGGASLVSKVERYARYATIFKR
jgi:hypothetical protein